MRIVIVGAGLVGTQLARHLIQEKHDVSLIESNEERARHASNRLDCLVLHDEGNKLSALKEAGIAKADALVCVTGSDEVNMITCSLAASRYPELLKIARVRNDDYVRLNQTGEETHTHAAEGSVVQPSSLHSRPEGTRVPERVLDIDHFVHPDVESSQAVLSALAHGAVGNILAFTGTPYELGSIDIAAGSSFDGLRLTDYRSLVEGESLVTLVERRGESLLPKGSTTLVKDDRIHILAREAEMDHIFRLAGRTEKPLRRIGIVGGGRAGALIAGGLLDRDPEFGKRGKLFSLFKSFIPKNGRRVVIIEQNYGVCKDLAARFPEALILNEDISDESFIAEERIGDLDLIITATANQELNIIVAIYLKSRGVRRAIVLVTSSGYEAIARQLGVDVVIPMKTVVVDSILSRLLGGGIRGVHRLGDGSIGIIEIEIGPDSPAVEKPITAFRLSGGGLVMLVNRGIGSFIPLGDYMFKAGDKIALIAKNGNEAEIEKFFGPSK
ncbi:MAG: NAD-binding protein [Treponema sp.]|jgi:trk system potassium uptake protein TrkA|nr:NAD-binding protein [Treponema sp.]